MLFCELKKQYSFRTICEGTSISRMYLWLQVNKQGFSANTIKQLISKYPELDINDLLNNYPKDGKNGKENIT